MEARRTIIFTVTNDLSYDQRMNRICNSLAEAGYDVLLVGFLRKNSIPLESKKFRQHRIPIIAEKGKLLYVDYWVKLFRYLMRTACDAICAIDLDTILPVMYASRLRKVKRVYDAHELFTELKEVISRPLIHNMWLQIERRTVPKFPVGYTIGECYAEEFERRYGVRYAVVRNATLLKPLNRQAADRPFILYQGAVNVGRRFEQLIPAMQWVNAPLIVCGDGNFYQQAQALAKQFGVTDKVMFKGYVPPEQLEQYTREATIGITLFEDTSLSNRLSMANRYFDYMHHAVPQLCVDYPEYRKVNDRFEIATLIADPSPEKIAASLNRLLSDKDYYQKLAANCLLAREEYCWQQEEKRLLKVYEQLFSD